MPNFLHFLEQQVTLLIPFPFPILLFLLFIPLLIKWLLFSKNSNTGKNLPPSPSKLPLIGNLHQLGKYPHRSLQKLSQRYGPIMFLKFGSKPAVIISSPDGAREIMQTKDLIFANRPESKMYKKLLYNMQDISTIPYGESFRQLKGICTRQILSKKRVLSFHSVRDEEIARVVEMMKDQYCKFSKPVNLSETFAVMSNNVVGKAVFGREYDCGENGTKLNEILPDFFWLLGLRNLEDFIPWLSWINHVNGKNVTVDRVVKDIDEFLEGLVEDRLSRLEKKITNEEHDKENYGEDFVDIMLRIHTDKNSPNSLGRDNIKAIILVIASYPVFYMRINIISGLLARLVTDPE